MEFTQNKAKPLSKTQASDMRKIDRLALNGKATRSQLVHGMKLHRQHDAAYRAAYGL